MYLKRPSSACKESYSRMCTLSLGVQRELKRAKESMQRELLTHAHSVSRRAKRAKES